MRVMKGFSRKLGAAALLLLGGCLGDEASGEGEVRVLLDAEESISEGLSVGRDVEDARDYAVRYTKLVVVIGDVALERDGERRTSSERFVVDLTRVGSAGLELLVWNDVPAGRWDGFGYSLRRARGALTVLGGVAEADVEHMRRTGLSHLVEGVVERPEAAGGPLTFRLEARDETAFSACRHDGEPGLEVIADSTQSAAITLHGDHLWFNAFPGATEGTIERRTGWLLEADADGDGHVTPEELEALPAIRVFRPDFGYSLDGAPRVIETAQDWVEAQLATQGHFQGEGECNWSQLGSR